MKAQPLFFPLIFATSLIVGSCQEHHTALYVVEPTVDAVHRGQVHDLSIYVYDTKDRYIGHFEDRMPTVFNMNDFQGYQTLKFVVWGNSKSGGVRSSAQDFNNYFSSHTMMLEDSASTFNGLPLKKAPSNLFHTLNLGTFESQTDHSTVGCNRYYLGQAKMQRLVSSYSIVFLGALDRFGVDGNDLKVMIKHPFSGFDFSGQSIGKASHYLPSTRIDAASDRIETNVTNALPTGNSNIEISLYHNSRLLYNSATDPKSWGLRLQSDMFHRIVVRFGDNDNGGALDLEIETATWEDHQIEGVAPPGGFF